MATHITARAVLLAGALIRYLAQLWWRNHSSLASRRKPQTGGCWSFQRSLGHLWRREMWWLGGRKIFELRANALNYLFPQLCYGPNIYPNLIKIYVKDRYHGPMCNGCREAICRRSGCARRTRSGSFDVSSYDLIILTSTWLIKNTEYPSLKPLSIEEPRSNWDEIPLQDP